MAEKKRADRRRKEQGLTYQVTDPEQLRALVSTVRADIMDQVAAFGPLSVREIGALTGTAPSSLYHHVQQLTAVGLLLEAGVRQTAKKPEQLYDTPAPRMRMLDALQDPANQGVLNALVDAVCKQANRDFARGFAAPHRQTTGQERNVRFARLVCRPDAATLAQINAHLDAVTELIARSADGSGERIAYAWVVAPQGPRRGKR
ncbi:DNA-binding transcriptional ArsR family regulator [Caulobacter ginsengisoli]|uniref:DNA-binding transcriptional ArsR family regulator n=1 Tax=Caulobacter ginsengisoli TaxID=400775 RepID=A0ABU0IUA5_9CAUL|nr:helix-turn-helix domain-containing protein [Caulobacter ginsengisoli]MDQ0465593.1 DNA-binding transcriptional ArsR family regulator [Caulobacter ginsengisoli]